MEMVVGNFKLKVTVFGYCWSLSCRQNESGYKQQTQSEMVFELDSDCRGQLSTCKPHTQRYRDCQSEEEHINKTRTSQHLEKWKGIQESLDLPLDGSWTFMVVGKDSYSGNLQSVIEMLQTKICQLPRKFKIHHCIL